MARKHACSADSLSLASFILRCRKRQSILARFLSACAHCRASGAASLRASLVNRMERSECQCLAMKRFAVAIALPTRKQDLKNSVRAGAWPESA